MEYSDKLAELAEGFPKEAIGVCINSHGDYHFMPEGEQVLNGYTFYSKAEVLAQKRIDPTAIMGAMTLSGHKVHTEASLKAALRPRQCGKAHEQIEELARLHLQDQAKITEFQLEVEQLREQNRNLLAERAARKEQWDA